MIIGKIYIYKSELKRGYKASIMKDGNITIIRETNLKRLFHKIQRIVK